MDDFQFEYDQKKKTRLKKGPICVLMCIICLMIGGDVYTEQYGKLDIYACRLYNKILTDEEVKNNCEMTVNYHNMLVNQKINN